MSCPELRDPRSLRITQNRTNWRLSLTVIGHCLLSPLEEVGACIIHEGKEASAFNVVKSRYETYRLLLDRDPLEGSPIASQPTLSRFENGVNSRSLVSMSYALTDIESTNPFFLLAKHTCAKWRERFDIQSF